MKKITGYRPAYIVDGTTFRIYAAKDQNIRWMEVARRVSSKGINIKFELIPGSARCENCLTIIDGFDFLFQQIFGYYNSHPSRASPVFNQTQIISSIDNFSNNIYERS